MLRFAAIGLVALALAGCETIEIPRATAIVPPTRESPPIAPAAAPTYAATTESTLGIPRSRIQARFEQAPFGLRFAEDTSPFGDPLVRGAAPGAPFEITLRGAAENLIEIQLVAIVAGQADRDQVAGAAEALIDLIAPGDPAGTAWIRPHLDRALRTGGADVIYQGKHLALSFEPETQALLFAVLPGD